MNIHGPATPNPRLPSIETLGVRPKPEAATEAAAHREGAGVERADATPTLWDLLTAEERAFFKQQTSLGPLTYRPGGAVSEPDQGPTGQRIDVKG